MKKKIILFIIALFSALVLWAYLSTYHPSPIEEEKVVCTEGAPLLRPGQKLKVLSWNVQYMAGKNYFFFYDRLDGSGPDIIPSAGDVEKTLHEVARVITEENPDLILLQEMDISAKRTWNRNLVEDLRKLLPESMTACHTSAPYWKAAFVPHPKVWGSAGMYLTLYSRYKIDSSLRHTLPSTVPSDPVTKLFDIKRAVQQSRLPMEGGGEMMVYNTHFEAFAQGTDTMARQVQKTMKLLKKSTEKKDPWIFAGDLNLLPPGRQYENLPESQRLYFIPKTELKPMFDLYRSVPSLEEANKPGGKEWLTHFSNDPEVKEPDRTIDYIFFSPLVTPGRHYVRHHDTHAISDHMPVITEITLPR